MNKTCPGCGNSVKECFSYSGGHFCIDCFRRMLDEYKEKFTRCFQECVDLRTERDDWKKVAINMSIALTKENKQ